MRAAALLATTSLVNVASADSVGYYVLSRTAGGDSQYCNVPSGSFCCQTEKAGPLDPVHLCFDNNRITVDAGSYGYYSLNTYSDYASARETFSSTFDTSQTKGSVWPFHGYAEEVTGTYGNPGSMVKFCHGGSQCCYAPLPNDDDTPVLCTAPPNANMDAVTITLKRGGVSVASPGVVLRVDTHGTPPNWYELAMTKSLSPRDVAGQFQSYFRATGGPFQYEKVSATFFDQASLNGNKSVIV